MGEVAQLKYGKNIEQDDLAQKQKSSMTMDAEKISSMETSHWRGVFKKPKILVLSQCFFFSKIHLEIC